MAKTKNKKRISADHIHNKKESVRLKVKMSPFEVHVNKEKLRVLGKRPKNDRGLPGISRTKAIEKRKHTLLQEYKIHNKANKFMDKRIGEKNHMNEEDKVMARFTAVRIKAHNKKSVFNLADDEVLTHRGQTLSEIEKFDNPASGDEESLDDDNNTGKLNKNFVDVHFGGGIFRNTGKEGAKTHKELIDHLIAESKKRKVEQQKTKEATLELTEKLDTEWKDLLPIVSRSKNNMEDNINKPKIDDYDKVMRELRFEARGIVSDRLKTEDEIAKEQKEKLEQLEKERISRMKGFVEEKVSKAKHRSADDLDDDFVYESDPEYMLSYNDQGESNVLVDAEINGKNVNSNSTISNNNDKLENTTVEADSAPEEENSEEETSDQEVETDSEDNLSDLKNSGESESETDDAKNTLNTNKTSESELKTPCINKLNYITDNYDTNEKQDVQNKIKTDLLKRKQIMEQAREELPYTFTLPESYESLQTIFENKSSYQQHVIIERMIKCNHPSLAEGNKDNLGLLFAYLLQHLNDLFLDGKDAKLIHKCFDTFNALGPQIYELAQLNPDNAHSSILEVIKEKHEEFKKRTRQYPGYEILMFFKLISLLFSTSDFRHQIVTPSFVFIEQMLIKCKVRNKRDISYGLFLTSLILEYTTLSRRYLPAAINFLAGILHMAIPKTGVKLVKVMPPFKSIESQLVLVENCSLEKLTSLKMESSDLINTAIEEEYKIKVLYNTIKLLEEFYENFKTLPSSFEIFETVIKYLELIPTKNYPKDVKNDLETFLKTLQESRSERKISFIAMERAKPKALRLYEPKIETVFDGKKFKVQSKSKAERDKMLYKLKQEKKGAVREIRRDKAFLGRVKIYETIKSDKERNEKVKRIFAEASMQQSELNEFDRKKKRKKN